MNGVTTVKPVFTNKHYLHIDGNVIKEHVLFFASLAWPAPCNKEYYRF